MGEAYERRAERDSAQNIELWRQARFVTFNLLRPHLKNQHLSITDFMKLPGDLVVDKVQAAQDARAAIEHYKKKGWLKATA